MSVSFEKLIELIKSYNPDEVEIITLAYEFAKKHHAGQFRQSGEEYITHPLAVAFILANMHADGNTICAGILHDVIEDCDVTKEEIASIFNETIANLVDGVTNLTQVNFKTKIDCDYATKRKIILGIEKDARIVIIKLADRLHNMLTLQYKNEQKRIEKASETMQFYVPLARYIGAEKLRRQLEDLSFYYLNPNDFLETKKLVFDYTTKYRVAINNMIFDIHKLLCDENIPHVLKLRVKNLYSVYQRVSRGQFIGQLHDFIAIKILVDSVKECYDALRIVHKLYKPCNSLFKDYIAVPRSNMYASIHTSVIGRDDVLMQAQIRTLAMEKTNLYGIAAYWDVCQGEAGNRMQEVLKEKLHFESSIKKISQIFNNQEFVKRVQKEILGENIKVYASNGRLVELPEGSTASNFAKTIGEEVFDKMVGVLINGIPVNFDTVLTNGDRVQIILDEERNDINNVQTVGEQKKLLNPLLIYRRKNNNEI